MPIDPTNTSRSAPIFSAAFGDGTLIETVQAASRVHTALLRHERGCITQHSFLDTEDRGRLVPYSATNNLLTHGIVLLPSNAEDYDSTTGLLADVRAFIHRYGDLSEGFEELASHYVLLSWLYDAFSSLPYLRLRGDYGSGKSRCLQTLGSLCYKPIFASGASTTSPLFRILDSVRGTLVLDESDFRFSDEKAELIKILNNGNAAGFPVLRSESTPQKEFNPRAFHVFGPKIIATRRAFEDQALESRCITEVMTGLPPRPDIPLNLPRTFHTEATMLRNKLLTYRFRNLQQPRDLEQFRDDRLEARVSQVFAPLLSVAENDETRERLLAFALGSTAILRADRSASVEAQLTAIISELRNEGVALGVQAIADRFSEQYAPDYERPITPRWIGNQLRRRLSLVPVKSHGTFVLPPSQFAKIDDLCKRYGVERERVDVGTSKTPDGEASAALA